MPATYPTEWPYFFTATNLNWLPILENDERKNIITGSLHYLFVKKIIWLHAFVLMNNHIHLIWQPMPGYSKEKIQLLFMKYSAQQIKFHLESNDKVLYEQCLVNKKDRKFQIWKRKPLSIELFTPAVYQQKLDYIHYNPVKAGLCKYPEEYRYSSARFYHDGKDEFGLFLI